MNKVKRFKRTISKLGYRTPDIFKRNIKHKIAKNKTYAKINGYGRIKKAK